ncbi:pyridoxal phosphate-dependent aminotransferase [Spirochaeta africana]|uniref:alanine transaminase n=1 Tax=Spirochaeta africana (strain ATCC 700263 / DSM 8902 / Z-7692) TaxID=889378 RepID=H9UG72_SPIAZ|nr:pyridoxal phosphate-dependent aminotransferase [Spirochaeta africana]AFG36515.1 aspartate/tyrosine/aromatic aminotransferase [Spirochaeta africana DSM 8902]
MRRQILHAGAGQLRYMIREIVQIAREIERLGQPVLWENIGDPVRKGESPPDWIKQLVGQAATEDMSYAYSDTQGEAATRGFLAERANGRLDGEAAGARITPDDILFFNGLGDAVSKLFGQLRPQARVIGPSPAYSTHSSAEAAHSGYEHLTYQLDPENGWLPDLQELENTIHYNPTIAGILIINPDNPTGVVYPRHILEGFVAIARRYNLFLICDETYAHVVYGGAQEVHLNQIIGDVPGIAMRSISKEFPWPGARCGWIEVYNRTADADFAGYVESILAAKRLEVCSTTLPQRVIPLVMGDARYAGHLGQRNREYESRAGEVCAALSGIPGVRVNRPQGGFFATPVFDPAMLPAAGRLEIANPGIRRLVEQRLPGAAADARFVYWLLGSTGICTVPLSGFCSRLPGFRMTLLESDPEVRAGMLDRLAAAIRSYG